MSLSSEIIIKKSKPNQTDNQLELFVINIFKNHEFTEITKHKKKLFQNRKNLKNYSQHILCSLNIYLTQRKCDFLIQFIYKLTSYLKF